MINKVAENCLPLNILWDLVHYFFPDLAKLCIFSNKWEGTRYDPIFEMYVGLTHWEFAFGVVIHAVKWE